MLALKDKETNKIYFCFQRAQSLAEERDMQTSDQILHSKYFSRRHYAVCWRREGDGGHQPTWDGMGTKIAP